MKNKALVFLISIGLVFFAGLIFSVYRFASNNGKNFLYEGYISVTDIDNSNRIYFTSGTSYKNGYNNEIIFKDASDKKQEVNKYNFVFYKNKSISFLTDGVIMSLDDFDTELVPYYNIKSNYLINYLENGYVINGKNKNINLNNFIGRISDTKYLVVGNNLKLKLSSSENLVEDYYFELSFIEGNQVKIVNENIDIKTISDESYIRVNDDVVIDLANKVIKYKDEVKVNLTEITINSDNNIDILYDNSKDKEEHSGNGGEGTGEGNGNGGNNSKVDPQVNEPEEYEPEHITEYKNIPYAEILSSSIGSNYIDLKYKINDKFNLITGPITVKYTNLSTKQTYEQTCIDYSNGCLFQTENLTSDTDYAVSIMASYARNGIVHKDFTMFQRTFRTSKIKVELVKDYASNDTLAYVVKMGELSGFSMADVNLYDENGNLVDSKKIINDGKDQFVVFDELHSNKSYTAKIENVKVGNITYVNGYASISTNKTLKYNPLKDNFIINNPIVEVNKKDYLFKFDLGTVNDKDHAIKEVKYNIYDTLDNTLVKTITKADAKAFSFDIDSAFVKGHRYVYNAVFAINDNEKTLYQTTLYSNEFSIDSLVIPYAVFDKGEVTANTLEGIFKIFDPDNTININEKVYIKYVDSVGNEYPSKELSYTQCPSSESETTKCVKLYLDSLSSDSTYITSLYSYVDIKDDSTKEDYIAPGFMNISTVQITTQVADIVYATWEQNDIEIPSDVETVFSLNLQFYLGPDTSDNVKENLSTFDLILYEGADANTERLKTVTVSQDILNDYFDNKKEITLATFGYTLDDLISRHMDSQTSLSKTYTIKISNGKSGIDYVDFKPNSFSFDIDERLLQIFDNSADIELSIIENIADTEYYDEQLDQYTALGFRITPLFDNNNYVKKIAYKIYDVTDNESKLEPFELTVDNINLNNGDILPSEDIIFTDEKYNSGFFKRGHSYQVEYVMQLDLNNDGLIDIEEFPLKGDLSGSEPVVSSVIDIPKQRPKMKLVPWSSDSNSIIYRYNIDDIDNVTNNKNIESIFYSINDSEEVNSVLSVTYDCINNSGSCYFSTKVTDAYNTPYGYNFENEYEFAKLINLNDKDVYTIKLKGKLLDRNDASDEYFDINKFSFDGTISKEEMQKHIKFTLPDYTYHNIYIIKIDDDTVDNYYLNKIASYSLEISGKNNEDKNVSFKIENINNINSYNFSNVSANNVITYNNEKTSSKYQAAYINYCDTVNKTGTCLYFDYSKLYNQNIDKSVGETFKNGIKSILGLEMSIKLSYYFDSGNVGFYKSDSNNRFALKFDTLADEYADYNGKYYIYAKDSGYSGFGISNSALSSIYSFKLSSYTGGFVLDSSDDNSSSGQFTLQSNIYVESGNLSTSINKDYNISHLGVLLEYNKDYVPVVLKRLNVSDLYAPMCGDRECKFKYSSIVPAMNIITTDETLNGVAIEPSLTGIDYDSVDPNNKNVYFEIYKKNNEELGDELVQTFDISENEFNNETINCTKQSGSEKYVCNLSESNAKRFRYNVVSVKNSSNGKDITNYNFDYSNNSIIVDEYVEKVNVLYILKIFNLEMDSNYYIKSYMKLKDNSGNYVKTYLIDGTSPVNNNYIKSFKTLNLDDIKYLVSDVSIDVKSNMETDAGYNKLSRYLDLNYTIGTSKANSNGTFDSFAYYIYDENGTEINHLYSDDENSCPNDELFNIYSNFPNSCIGLKKQIKTDKNPVGKVYAHLFVQNDSLDNSIYNSDNPDYKQFIFGNTYKVDIYGSLYINGELVSVPLVQQKGDHKYNIRKLDQPVLLQNDVIKTSVPENDDVTIRFTIPYVDTDLVSSAFTYSENGCSISNYKNINCSNTAQNGEYLYYISEGNVENRISNIMKMNYTKCRKSSSETVDDKKNVITYACTLTNEDFKNNNGNVTFEKNKEYYLVIKHNNDTHNKNEDALVVNDNIVIFTPNDYGISSGRVQYEPRNEEEHGISKLMFTFADNIMLKMGEDSSQQAYVAGIKYNVKSYSGDEVVASVGDGILFNENIGFKYEGNNQSNDDSYYYVELKHDKFKRDTEYVINFNFIIELLNVNQDECTSYTDSYWENGKCYVVDNITHNSSSRLKK